MNRILADLRLALRAWRKSPGFTAIAIASIAVGIGANTAIFTLVDQVLPAHFPSRIPRLWFRSPIAVRRSARTGATEASCRTSAMHGLPRQQPGLRRHVLPVQLSDAHRLRRPNRARRRRDRLGDVFSRSRRHAGGRPPPYTRRRQGSGWTSRRCVESRLLDEPLRGRPLDCRQVHGRQRPSIHRHRRRAGWLRRRRARRADSDLRSHDDEGAGHAGVERSRRSPLVVAAGVRPLKPGVSPEQAQAALAPFYRSRLEMEVKEPAFANVPERGRKRFLDNKLSIVPAAQGRSGLPRVHDDAAVGADGDGGRRPADCVRERRQPAARARRGVSARWPCGSRWARRAAVSCASSSSKASCSPLPEGRRSLAVGRWRAARVGLLRQSGNAAADLDGARPSDSRFHVRRFRVDGHPLRAGARAAFHETNARANAQGCAGSVLGGGQARIRKALVATQVGLSLLLLDRRRAVHSHARQPAGRRYRVQDASLISFSLTRR